MSSFPDRAQIVEAYELALDVPARPRTINVGFLLDDKAVFDQLQTWLSLKEGRRLTQWETMTRVLAFVLEHPDVDALGLRESSLVVSPKARGARGRGARRF
jgi:hypothetical protein